MVILKSWIVPFPLRFEEQCKCIASDCELIPNKFDDSFRVRSYPICSLFVIELNTPALVSSENIRKH